MENSDLAVVIPVYNEHQIIEVVINDWDVALKQLSINYEIHVYNDGSKDNTLAVLESFAAKYPRLKIHNKSNSGHGPTILTGYRENLHAEWIFQVDSDNEISAAFFKTFWNKRAEYDFIIGTRQHHNRPLARRVISYISLLLVSVFYGRGIKDVNVPYRLMRSINFSPFFNSIPPDTFAPNVIVSGCAVHKRLRIKQIPISSHLRETGEVSIKKWKLFKVALKSFNQTIRYRLFN
jgi:dolichol-phosphate mannosyltransferase